MSSKKKFSSGRRDVAERFNTGRKEISATIKKRQADIAERFNDYGTNPERERKKLLRRIKKVVAKSASSSLLQPQINDDTNLADYVYIGNYDPSSNTTAIDASMGAYNKKFEADEWLYRDYLYAVGHIDSWQSQLYQFQERVKQWQHKNEQTTAQYEHKRDAAIARANASENSTFIDPYEPTEMPMPQLHLNDDHVSFIHSFDRNKYTPDRHGFLNYIKEKTPDFHKNIIRKNPFYLKEVDRLLHTYIVGGSGSGKSELLKGIIHNYVSNKSAAVVVLDPNGDFAVQIAKWQEIAKGNDLAYLEYNLKSNHSFTINPFVISGLSTSDKSPSALKTRIVVANQLQEAFIQIVAGGSGGDDFSVNMKALLMPCLTTLLEYEGATILDLQRFMNDSLNNDLIEFAKTLTHHPNNVTFFESEFMDKSYSPTKKAVAKKIRSLLNFPPFYHLTCGRNTVDIERLMNERKTIIFNLSKGAIGESVMGAFGRLVVSVIQGVAMRRESIPRSQRVPCHLFLDECHNFISPSIEEILVESRKYALHLTMAQQVVGYKMTMQLRSILGINTVIKLSGKMPNTAWTDTAAYLGVPTDMFSELMKAKGQFICAAAGSPPIVVGGRADLLDENNGVLDFQWEDAKKNQLENFYRNYLEDDSIPKHREIIVHDADDDDSDIDTQDRFGFDIS